jgi:hypothetical protein
VRIIFFGYVDPGLGLLAWQAVVAVFLGIVFYLKKTRNWLLALCRKIFRPGKTAEPPATALKTSRNIMGQ